MNFIEWNVCPSEIVCLIFSYLDARTLVKCMSVSRQWKDVAEHMIEHYKLWPEIVNNEMINNAKTYIHKSTLDLRNIYKNYALWRHVNISHITNVKTYEMQVVKKINVYKDKLTIVADSCVMFYDINTCSLKRTIDYNIKCVNYEENDYLVVMVDEDDEKQLKLHYYVKCDADKFDNPDTWYTFDRNIQLYRLDKNFCYIYSDNKLWMLTDTIMYTRFVARHYGSDYDPVTAIHVHNDSVYLVTRWGTVWCADLNAVKFDKVCSLWVPLNIKHHSWVMFDNLSCVVAVNSTTTDLVNVIYDPASDALRLECPELTCALQHGDVLLLGYKDGTIEIRIPEKKIDSSVDPNRRFNIQQYAEDLDDSAIIDINVCEIENAHVLFASTKARVFQLLISYPEYLL